MAAVALVVVLVGEPRSWSLTLPFTKPPLSLNARVHHMTRWRLEQQVKSAVILLARSQRIPELDACSVQLHYRPTSNRRRDTDNLMATLKPVADGLVAAGVVADDTPEFMARPEPIIHEARRLTPAQAQAAQILWVVVTEVILP